MLTKHENRLCGEGGNEKYINENGREWWQNMRMDFAGRGE
jgi:hypothetical protein